MKYLPITSPETLAACASELCRDNDIFICSYPKSGTTWTQNIITTLLLRGEEFDHVSTYAPFYEIDPHWDNGVFHPKFDEGAQRLGRRVFNTHLLWNDLPKSPKAKYVYLVRDGRDVVVSFFHHLSSQGGAAGGFEGTFEEFYSKWMQGDLPYGRWVDHLHAWDVAADNEQVLFIRYEEMKVDLKSIVLKIATHCNIPVSEDDIAEWLPRFSVEYMKEKLDKYQPISVEWKNDFKFVRKGEVGDHASLFTDEMQESYANMVKECFTTRLPAWAT